jgi:hypothetical protein
MIIISFPLKLGHIVFGRSFINKAKEKFLLEYYFEVIHGLFLIQNQMQNYSRNH